jgi:hypothetical protein
MNDMSFLDDVKKLVDTAVSGIEKASDDLKTDLESGINTIEGAVSDLQSKLGQDVANLETDFAEVLSTAAGAWNSFSNDVNTIRSVASGWFALADTQTQVTNLKTMAQARTLTDETYNDLLSMYTTLSQAATNSPSAVGTTLSKTLADFDTFSFSFGSDAAVVASFDGGLGFAAKTHKPDYRFTADLSVGLGADLEIDAFTNVGIWKKSPDQMKGSFLALEVAGADAVGLAAVAVFDFPQIDLIGFVFGVEVGEGIDIDSKLGYTMTWQ